jgi:hypothetical protein
MSNLVKHGKFDIQALDEVDKKVDAIAGSVFIDFNPGDTVLRFLPPQLGSSSPFRVTALHYVDAVPGIDRLVVFACPRTELKQDCPVCDEVRRLQGTQNPVDRERAFRLSAGLRVYANVIDRNNEDAGPRVAAFGKTIWEALKSIRRNTRLGGDFTDPSEAGFDIIVHREGTGKVDTRYTVNADRSSSPLSKDPTQAAKWLEEQHDLEQFVDPRIPEDLLRAWGAMARLSNEARAPQLAGPRRSAVSDAKAKARTVEADPFDDEKA